MGDSKLFGNLDIEGRNEADREVKLWEKVEEYLGTKLASLTYEHNKPHALTAFK